MKIARTNNSEVVLLLTATLRPQVNYMKVSSVDTRKEQYLKAINWYLDNTSYPIVIGENSGSQSLISEIDINKRNRIELICWIETNTSQDYYGFNELLILEKVKKESIFLKGAKVICKITGRLIVKNIECHVSQVRNHKGGFIAGNMSFTATSDYIDTRFFIFSIVMYDKILSVKNSIKPILHSDFHKIGKEKGIYPSLENAVGSMLYKETKIDKNVCVFLKHPIFFSGQCGYNGVRYDMTFSQKLRTTLFHYLRVIRFNYFVLPSI